MPDLKRVSLGACVFLVVLRMAIGWQFLYEGVWKLDTLDTARPWSAEGYLKNAKGPFRESFRSMTGDPDDLQWADYDWVAARWDDWQRRFVAHFGLSDDQQRELDVLLNGKREHLAELEQLPDGVEFRGSLGRALKYDPERKRLIVPGDWHMTPDELQRALRLVTVVPAQREAELSDEERRQNELARAYQRAVRRVYDRQRRLAYKERLAASLKGDPERTGVLTDREGNVVEEQLGQIELYRNQIGRYENKLEKVEQDFQYDHIQKQFAELQELRVRVVGPVRALENELQQEARKLLTAEQLALGPVRSPQQLIDYVDLMTIGALTVLGFLLIAGLFTRLAAFAGACLLFSFYLAMPPWPGVPGFQELPGPEHSYIVDKNLIEVFALLAIALLPTGKWFGLDAFFAGLRARRKANRARRVGDKRGSQARPARGPQRANATEKKTASSAS